MKAPNMTAQALRKIEQGLNALADDVRNHDVDDLQHDLRVIAIQIGAQAEMMENGLTEREATNP